MKRLLRLSYKLGRATAKLPKPSLKPIKRLVKAFMAGRADSKPQPTVVVKTEPTTIVVDWYKRAYLNGVLFFYV